MKKNMEIIWKDTIYWTDEELKNCKKDMYECMGMDESYNNYEEQLMDMVEDYNYLQWKNLVENFKEVNLPEDIIVIGDLGLWDGRKSGYKEVTGLDKCFYTECDFNKWFLENDDLKSENVHHDGTNYLLYRMWKNGISETRKNNFKDKICSGKLKRRDIYLYTVKLGEYIKEVI